MKFLANENFPFPSTSLLRNSGHYVYSISEESPGISDLEVIDKAKSKGLIILTFDKDYGEIIFKHSINKPPSVIFFKFKGENPKAAAETLIDLLKTKDLKIENRFTVIEKENIRQRNYEI